MLMNAQDNTICDLRSLRGEVFLIRLVDPKNKRQFYLQSKVVNLYSTRQ